MVYKTQLQVPFFVDIETLPTENPKVIEHITKNLKAPANYKNPEAIQKWKDENVEEAILKTSFNGAFGSVLCIGTALQNDEIDVLYSKNERQLLIEFKGLVDEWIKDHAPMSRLMPVGHFVKFDLGFLYQRFMVNGIKWFPQIPAFPKPWDDTVFDTMFKFAGQDGRISMDDLCMAFGIEGKGDEIDGSKVYQFYKEGRIQEILDYCKGDVSRTRQIFNKMTAGA